MRFLLDENVHLDLIPILEAIGHDVATVAHLLTSSADDSVVLAMARADERVLITYDRDFGGLIFRNGEQYSGVLYFRLRGTSVQATFHRLLAAIEDPSYKSQDFLVITDKTIRVRRS